MGSYIEGNQTVPPHVIMYLIASLGGKVEIDPTDIPDQGTLWTRVDQTTQRLVLATDMKIPESGIIRRCE